MNPLQIAIMRFNNWSQPWAFYNFVLNGNSLGDEDKKRFQSIWVAATDKANWQQENLEKSSKVAAEKIRTLYRLGDDAIEAIIRAASYEWR